jgi:hypothetical protein
MKKKNSKLTLAARKSLLPLTRNKTNVLNVTFLYEEPGTRSWAREAYEQVCQTHGAENIRATWWKMNDLTVPGVLAGAVSTAMRADMVIIAATGSEGLPLPFYFWMKSWAPHRQQTGGVLSAILGAPEQNGARGGRVADYLGAIAAQTGMQFKLEQRSIREQAAVESIS